MTATMTRGCRRALVLSACYTLLAFIVVASPVLFALTLLADLILRRRWSTSRALLFFVYYLFCQFWGSIGCIAIYVLCRGWSKKHQPRFWAAMFWIEYTWADVLARGSLKIWSIRLETQMDYEFGERPIIMLVRHASIADTFLPLVCAIIPQKLEYAYVMKSELRWDPCIDMAVTWLPHLFVDRGSGDSRKEIEKIGRLAGYARGPKQGVVIFPEGTRHTPAKQKRILEKLRSSDPEGVLEWAEKYQHVLPPRLGGPLELLKQNPGADIVICAHTGLERSTSFRETFNGGLVGTVGHIRFWGIRYEDLPTEPPEQKKWLLGLWQEVDDYIEAHRAGDTE